MLETLRSLSHNNKNNYNRLIARMIVMSRRIRDLLLPGPQGYVKQCLGPRTVDDINPG